MISVKMAITFTKGTNMVDMTNIVVDSAMGCILSTMSSTTVVVNVCSHDYGAYGQSLKDACVACASDDDDDDASYEPSFSWPRHVCAVYAPNAPYNRVGYNDD